MKAALNLGYIHKVYTEEVANMITLNLYIWKSYKWTDANDSEVILLPLNIAVIKVCSSFEDIILLVYS